MLVCLLWGKGFVEAPVQAGEPPVVEIFQVAAIAESDDLLIDTQGSDEGHHFRQLELPYHESKHVS